MQVTTKVVDLQFGSLTRVVESGTESVYLLKIEDIYGSHFNFILGEPEDFNGDMEDTCASLLSDICQMVGLEDADD